MLTLLRQTLEVAIDKITLSKLRDYRTWNIKVFSGNFPNVLFSNASRVCLWGRPGFASLLSCFQIANMAYLWLIVFLTSWKLLSLNVLVKKLKICWHKEWVLNTFLVAYYKIQFLFHTITYFQQDELHTFTYRKVSLYRIYTFIALGRTKWLTRKNI